MNALEIKDLSKSFGGFERTRPRAFGIMQYEQLLSQPSSIFTKARVRSSIPSACIGSKPSPSL